jgi:hypothetical protein
MSRREGILGWFGSYGGGRWDAPGERGASKSIASCLATSAEPAVELARDSLGVGSVMSSELGDHSPRRILKAVTSFLPLKGGEPDVRD